MRRYRKDEAPPGARLYYDFTRDPFCGKALDASGKFAGVTLTNLIDGSFESGLTGWYTLAKTPVVSSIQKRSGNNSLQILVNNEGSAAYRDVDATDGDILYCCAWIYRIDGPISVRLFDRSGVNNPVTVNTPTEQNVWEFISLTKIAANGGARLYIHTSVSNTSEYYIDDIFVRNLTKEFGKGKEPSTDQMNEYMKMQSYFTSAAYSMDKSAVLYGPKWVPQGLLFDGVDDHCIVNDNPDVDIITASYEKPLGIWSVFATYSDLGNKWVFTKNDDTAGETQYGLYYTYTGQKVECWLEGANRVVIPEGSIQVNVLYFVGFIWDGSTVSCHINGKLVGTGSFSGTLTSRPNIRLGCRGNNTLFLKGLISEMLITQGSNARDIINWFQRTGKAQKYGIAM